MKKDKIGIIDVEAKGNVVRFYLGDTTANYWGDDWNDKPWEYNAETVYDDYVSETKDIAFSYDCIVLQPLGRRYSKEDMKARRIPCLIVVPPAVALDDDSWLRDDFWDFLGNDRCIHIYFNDSLTDRLLELSADGSSGSEIIISRKLTMQYELEHHDEECKEKQ